MICISIAQKSRRLVLADMLNAARAGDLIEIRLDHFENAPNVGDLLASRPKPVIISCRRVSDGGSWEGSEEQRLALLRQCIISKADYVEIELDVADKIPPYPPAKRVISYTQPWNSSVSLVDVYAKALTKKPDAIKITALARTPEEAWPLVQLLSRATVPTVVVGLGRPGVMLNFLGRRMGAPWTYAALERGMEAYPGMVTINDLLHVYHYPVINRETPLIGVTGLGERDRATVAALNAGFAHLGSPVRCLPLAVGDVQQFLKLIESVKLSGAVIAAEHRRTIPAMTASLSDPAARLHSADVILPNDNRWHGHDTLVSAAIKALEETLKERTPARALAGQMVAIVGGTDISSALGRELTQRGCVVILVSRGERKATHVAALELGCRAIQFEALYSTGHDVLIVCEEEEKDRGVIPLRDLTVHPGYFHSGMTLLHLTSALHKSALVLAAEARGCTVVKPHRLWLDQVELQAQLLTGQEIPRTVLENAAPWLLEEE